MELKQITNLKNVECIYVWSINNFDNFLERKCEILSPYFPHDPQSDVKWRIILYADHLYPKGAHLGLSLVKLSDDGKSHGVRYKIYIADETSTDVHLQTREKLFRHRFDFDECRVISFCELKKQKYFQNGTLNIRCEMDILVTDEENEMQKEKNHFLSKQNSVVQGLNNFATEKSFSKQTSFSKDIVCNSFPDSYNVISKDLKIENTTTSASIQPYKSEESLCYLSDDFKSLYMNNNFSDVIISVDGIEMRAHKAILTSRCEYFKTACAENKSNRIFITGIKSAVLEAILYYLYTGKMRELTPEFAMDFLASTKKFKLFHLQKMITEFLKNHININNVTDILLLSEELHLEDLKMPALKFVSSRHADVTKLEKWNKMIKGNPHLAGEVFLTVASSQTKNVSSLSAYCVL